ncbi:transcriptional regulator ExuR [Celerinatantimonas sp. MCCC 1A17872]|uniref:transcriptional regulator ExuR n=1 Tax=Celerinatantimonas sp. MCCC 1A17872 TaxID=3177514 RepID=UPI0038C9D1B8
MNNIDTSFHPKRLYQSIAAKLKAQIASGIYQVGDRLPAERLIAETMNVSRTVIREAIIMLEVEGLVEVRKGSGIHIIASQVSSADETLENANDGLLTAGPFELLQARQLLESNIAEFAATQVTKQDILELTRIVEQGRYEDRARDSAWDKQFHIQVAKATQNSVLVIVIENLWVHRDKNPYWLKLHSHIDDKAIDSWTSDHEQILRALMRKDPREAKLTTWQHLENTKEMLFKATNFDGDLQDDRYLFSENPVIHLNNSVKK